MEHLGSPISGLQGFRVPLVTDLDDDNYTSASFHRFPAVNGWDLSKIKGQPTVNENIGPYDKRDSLWKIARFAQRYLFFEVLKAVFEPDEAFSYKDFVSRDERWVDTNQLPVYLQRWEHRERHEKDRSLRRSRLVRVQLVLDNARQYVVTHCAVNEASEDSHWPIDPIISLSFMVLGETLSRALLKIQQASNSYARGWHDQELSLQGWGYSKHVLKELRDSRGWCPKTVRMLQGLFRGNTIGLLYAIPFASDRGRYHGECTSTTCQAPLSSSIADVTSPGETIDANARNPNAYKTRHIRTFCSHHQYPRTPCLPKGLETSKIAEILDRGHIPLFYYDRRTRTLKTSEMANWNEDYAIFSHVWTDGFGNPDRNEINQCVLELFSQLFDNIQGHLVPNLSITATPPAGSVPRKFWIDTLAIPVGDAYSSQRRKAIEKMHDVYSHAKCTVVLDAGLMNKEIAHDLIGPAMMITMCAWMTRLWTLQEAYLSKRLYFNFSDKLCPMDQLEDELRAADRAIHDPIPAIALTFYHGFLGTEREKLKYERAALLRRRTRAAFVAEVWKAIQWRTTNHLQHETLALATLFNISTDPFADSSNTANSEAVTTKFLERRMKRLLQMLSELEECAIPPGLIFLPGPRLSDEGFRWAPRSWLTAHEYLTPDPITHSFHSSRLRANGLEVTYPGFLIHRAGKHGYYLHGRDEFHFPSHLRLAEWYHVTKADPGDRFPRDADLRGRDLAIIAMSLPAAHSKVVALLVVINRTHAGQYDVDITNRIWLHREGDQDTMKNRTSAFKNDNLTMMIFGEALSETQTWCVDGPAVPDADSQPAQPPPVRSGAMGVKTTVSTVANMLLSFANASSGANRPRMRPTPEPTSQ